MFGKVVAGALGVILILGGAASGSGGVLLVGLVLFTGGIAWDFVRDNR